MTGTERRRSAATGSPWATAAEAHLDALTSSLHHLHGELGELEAWGRDLAAALSSGQRLLTAGNGGSAAHAEHLAAEIVGRYRQPRPPFAAIALSAAGSTVTALVNDYGAEEMFARQVRAHGRPGDVLVALSTSGRSANVIRAATAGREEGLEVWSLSGPRPNPLADASTRVLAVPAERTATVQEVHQVAVHLLCAAFDAHLDTGGAQIPRLEPTNAGKRSRAGDRGRLPQPQERNP